MANFNNDGITYNIYTNPSTLHINQVNEVLQSATLQYIISQNRLDFDVHEYRLQIFTATETYGFDIFEIDGDSVIELGHTSATNRNVNIKIKTLENIPNGNYSGFLFFNLSKRLAESNDPFTEVAQIQVKLTASFSLPTSYNFSLNKGSETIHLIRSTGETTTAIVNVTSDTNYEVTGPAYLRINGAALPLSFNGNKTLQITTVDHNELIYGLNPKTITFKKANLNLANFLVNINVTNTSNLEASITELHYQILSNATESDAIQFTIYAPNGPITFSKPSWLELTLESRQDNFYQYSANALKLDLNDGIYSENLRISSGSDYLIIPTLLEIYGYWNEEYNKEIHFTKDEEFLVLSAFQRNQNNFIAANLQGQIFDNENYNRSINENLNFYFSNNKAFFDVGKYVHDYLLLYDKHINDINVVSTTIQLKKMYEPARIDLRITEKNYTTQEDIFWYSIPTQLYIQGHRPDTLTNENKGYLANFVNQTLRATINGKTILNFLSTNTDELNVYVNGNKRNILLPNMNNTKLSIYSFYMDFKNLNLEVGDLVEFLLGTQVIRYVIFPETNESNFIAYIDYWGLLKVFEVTGEYAFPFKQTYTSFNPKIGHVKNVSSTRNNTLKINTGHITEGDTEVIAEILQSPKCWFIHGNHKIEMIPITEEIALYDSAQQLFEYELEFHINPSRYDHNYGSR